MEKTKASREVKVQILEKDKERTKFNVTVELFPEKIYFIRISWPLIVMKFRSFAELKTFVTHNLDENNPRIFIALMECIDELVASNPELP